MKMIFLSLVLFLGFTAYGFNYECQEKVTSSEVNDLTYVNVFFDCEGAGMQFWIDVSRPKIKNSAQLACQSLGFDSHEFTSRVLLEMSAQDKVKISSKVQCMKKEDMER